MREADECGKNKKDSGRVKLCGPHDVCPKESWGSRNRSVWFDCSFGPSDIPLINSRLHPGHRSRRDLDL